MRYTLSTGACMGKDDGYASRILCSQAPVVPKVLCSQGPYVPKMFQQSDNSHGLMPPGCYAPRCSQDNIFSMVYLPRDVPQGLQYVPRVPKVYVPKVPLFHRPLGNK